MDEPTLIDKLSLDLAGAEPEKRADLWADAVRPLYDVSPLDGKAEDHLTRATVWLLDSLVLINAAFGGQLVHRRQRHLKTDVADSLVLEIYLSGAVRRDLAGEPVAIRPGDVNIMDYSREYQGRSSPVELINLLVSHDLIGYDPSRHPGSMRIAGDSAVGQVLCNTLQNTFRQLDRVTKAEAPAIARGLVALLRSVLIEDAATAQSSPTFASARSEAIHAYIERHLRAETLSADTICAQFNISRATLYRSLKADGGLERYIVARRLEAALMSLAFGPAERGAVTRAAAHWRFASTTHFSREFRRRFGFAPSDVVHQGQRAAIDEPDGALRHCEQRIDILPFLRRL